MNVEQLMDGFPSERGPIRLSVTETHVTVASTLAEGAHDYVHSARVLPVEAVRPEALRGLLGTPGLEVSIVAFYLDDSLERLAHQFLVPGRSPTLTAPEGARFLRFGLRVRGPGTMRLSLVATSAAGTEEDTSFAARTDTIEKAWRLAIFGSCVSRDALALPEAWHFVLDAYFARSSLGSLFAPPCTAELPMDRITSPFQRRVVEYDLSKEALQYLSAGGYDVLLYDPIDERFGIGEFEDGSVATLSNEFLLMKVPQSAYRASKSGSEAHYVRWEHGWRSLLATLEAAGTRDKLRVVRALWAQEVEGHPDVLPGASLAEVDEGNRYLERLYERMGQDLPADQILAFEGSMFVVDPTHKWGITPYHYPRRFYLTLLEKLRASLADSAGASD